MLRSPSIGPLPRASDAGAIDWTFIGHYSRQLPGFPPPAEQTLSFRATTLFELENDLVLRTTEFYDLYGLFVQLGLLTWVVVLGRRPPRGWARKSPLLTTNQRSSR